MTRSQPGWRTLLGSAVLVLCAALPGLAQECLDCHSQAGTSVEFKDGSKKDVTVDPSAWAASVHGEAGIGYGDCHSTHSEYPHPPLGSGSARDYTIANYTSCQTCHEDQFKKQLDGVHLKAIGAGNKNAAVCSDCHNPHAQKKITGDDGRLLPEGRVGIPGTCARCHGAIQEQYRQSVHGAALVDGNADVPTCIDCHGVHDITDPRTAAFRLASPRLCADCHTDAQKMAKYKLSTQVARTYVADFHGSTVTLFQRRHPDQVTGKPVCYDCHGVHDIASKSDPKKSLQVKSNLLATCRKCHPEASTNFPDAWLSHYVPTRERAPLVFWSRLAYQILIPTVVGGMALFVASDMVRRHLDRRRKRQDDVEPV
jgi:nitrate/TMAO reductase-like tetraheme cytochrome c subunit